MNIRPVKTESDYDAALDRIDSIWGAEVGTPDGDELDILLTLVSVYESENHAVLPPSPIEAIKFAMEQRGLKQADLIPYIGSRSKVSEVLNGKRSLTLSMIRALNIGLGLPAEVLIKEGDSFPEDGADMEWGRFPTVEIVSNGWVRDFDPRAQQEEVMRDLAAQAGVSNLFSRAACFRQGGRRNAKDDQFALQAWILKVLAEARLVGKADVFDPEEINYDFLRKVVQLSTFSDGPILAREYLLSKGIKLVVAPHLKRTYVDAVVLLESGATPVVGMSLRYDRVDNFWFTLLHELAHLSLGHLDDAEACIVDDLELNTGIDDSEREADQLAQHALIPEDIWTSFAGKVSANLDGVMQIARAADVHPAIVAGRIRHDKGNYRILSRCVGHGAIRKLFY